MSASSASSRHFPYVAMLEARALSPTRIFGRPSFDTSCSHYTRTRPPLLLDLSLHSGVLQQSSDFLRSEFIHPTASCYIMDRQSVYTLSIFPESHEDGDNTRGEIQKQLVTFILDFHIENTFLYRCVCCGIRIVRQALTT